MTSALDATERVRREIDALVRARYPLVYVRSSEEIRVQDTLAGIAERKGRAFWSWTLTDGLVETASGTARDGSSDPLTALNQALEMAERESAIFLFKDFHVELENRAVARKLKDAALRIVRTESSLFVLAPVLELPPTLEKVTTVLDFPLPTARDFHRLLRDYEEAFGDRATVTSDPEVREAVVRTLLGLTRTEAENVLSRALTEDRRLDAEDLDLLVEEKQQVVRKSGVLEFFSLRGELAELDLGSIGGLGALKGWLRRKRKSFSDEARAFEVEQPRGVLLIGVPGCGKSLTAKTVAREWQMPLLRFDAGKVFGSLVGESEANLREALVTAESVAPCVFWIDEIEKGFGGARGPSLDSGTTRRVFGTFITWMNEREAPVFVVATANDVERLPPELLRKGRFDELFFVDLPTAAERREIFSVHLARRGRDSASYDLDGLAERTRGYTGSGIEGIVTAGIERAFVGEESELHNHHLYAAIGETQPLSVTMREEIEHLRRWTRGRARSASDVDRPVPLAPEDGEKEGDVVD